LIDIALPRLLGKTFFVFRNAKKYNHISSDLKTLVPFGLSQSSIMKGMSNEISRRRLFLFLTAYGKVTCHKIVLPVFSYSNDEKKRWCSFHKIRKASERMPGTTSR
jgi:hypothetical protein